MAKFLSQILGDDYATAIFPRLPDNDRDAKNHYGQNSPDAQRFVDKHAVHKHEDRNGNHDDVFTASNVEVVDRADGRHGYNLGYVVGQDEKIHEGVGEGQKKWLDREHQRIEKERAAKNAKGQLKEDVGGGVVIQERGEDAFGDNKTGLDFQTDPIDRQTKAYGERGRYRIAPTERGHELSYYDHTENRVGFGKKIGHFPSHGLAVLAAHEHEGTLKEESLLGKYLEKVVVNEDDVDHTELVLSEILQEMNHEDVERVISIMENGTEDEIEELATYLTEISKDSAYKYLKATNKEDPKWGGIKDLSGRDRLGGNGKVDISLTGIQQQRNRIKGISNAIDRLAGKKPADNRSERWSEKGPKMVPYEPKKPESRVGTYNE